MPSAAAAIKFADDHLGSERWKNKQTGMGYCQTFVADCYRAAGVSVPIVGSAYGAKDRWGTHYDLSNIPAGAAIFFSSPTKAGQTYGHVGLHAGGGMVYHHWGKIVCWSLAQMKSKGIIPLCWGWESNTVLTGGGDSFTGFTGGGIVASTDAAAEAVQVVHIPQVEKVYTKYEADVYTKKEDEYRVTWQSLDTGKIRDITDRCEPPELTDDADSLCLELDLSVRQGGGDYYMKPLILSPGDFIAVTNVSSGEVVFLGQVQTVDGSYQSALRCRCLDGGRILTANECIIQFNNIPAKEALSQLANKVGISGILCPELVSSVYGIYRDTAASIAQGILDTIRGENGVRYFLRMVGETLTVRSFANEPISLWYRQANNLDSFDVFNEAAEPQLSWSIEELRNHITLYSGDDTGTVIQAELSDEESVKRYGKRMAVESWGQQTATISAADRAKVTLWEKNRVTESFTIETYGSDRAVAGALVYVKTSEVQGYFWITAVRHVYGTPHRMVLTLVRSDYTPPEGALSDDMGEALRAEEKT